MSRRILSVLILGFFCVSLMAQTVSEPATEAPKEKPYGCFRDLRWGMTPEQVGTSLGVKLKKWLPLEGREQYTAAVEIAGAKYDLTLGFKDKKLCRVTIRPYVLRGDYAGPDPSKAAEILYRAYKTMKPSLMEKYGKPTKEVEEDRGDDAYIVNNLAAHKAVLLCLWETPESNISLAVEITREVTAATPAVASRITYQSAPLLEYLQSDNTKKEDQPKADL